ncbi:hypothetical protein VTK26DRAFT_7785 [Humicola hyalothermophila]
MHLRRLSGLSITPSFRFTHPKELVRLAEFALVSPCRHSAKADGPVQDSERGSEAQAMLFLQRLRPPRICNVSGLGICADPEQQLRRR